MENISEPQITADKSPHDELATELRQRLSRELADGKFEQARSLVNALELVRNHSQGRTIDWDSHPLGADLRRELEPPEKPGRPPTDLLKLSASRITTYESCSLKFRFQYIDEIPQKDTDSPAMTVGRIVHSVLEEYHRPGQPEGGPAILNILDRQWDPAAFTYEQEAAQFRREAEKMLTDYAARSAAAKPQVLGVEHSFEFQLDNVQIRGVIDRIDLEPGGGIGLVDYKTGRSFLTPKKARQELQLGLYAIYVEQAQGVDLSGQPLGELPRNVTYYYLRSDEPEVQVQFAADDLDDHRARVKATADGIRDGIFEETGDDWTCQYCDYKDLICPKFEQPEG